MRKINKFFLRDVRCFGGEHEFDIRPLTFLIGENSTGKSTILGCLQALSNLSEFRDHHTPQIDFNFEPYQMGTFTDIVRRSTPRKEDFHLGFEYEYKGKRIKYFLTLTERGGGSEPIIHSTRWIFDDGEIIFTTNGDQQNKERKIKVRSGKNQNQFYVSVNRHWASRSFADELFLFYFLLSDNPEELDSSSSKLLEFIDQQFPTPSSEKSRLRNLHRFRDSMSVDLSRIHSIAPIRSKPKRTYDPLKETETPDGSEIPMMLMNLSISSEKKWEGLRTQLQKFGHASGLFSAISIRKLGRSRSDPFQLRIKVRGPSTNLMDVGYGICQVLPILVRIFTGENTKFLLQQPEVHLHPKGQAELASLLIDINRMYKNSFIIETHSDYMIDRARIEILNGKIRPEDVSLIYLEPVGNQVKTHNIGFDAQANMINVPEGYRSFFLNESDKLLGI